MLTGHVEASSARWPLLGVAFDFVTYAGAFGRLLAWRNGGQRGYVTITNPHSVMLAGLDTQMRAATAGAGLTLPDGVGVILAAKLLNYPHQGRVTGPTLMLKVCDWGRRHGLRHYFYGGAEGVADTLAVRLVEMFPGLAVAGTLFPPFCLLSAAEDEEIVGRINAARPDIVWVGLGAPKQETWMASHVGRIDAAALIGVGAAFDFHAGKVKWAPAWIRRFGLEWVYRTIHQPRRMLPRVVHNVRFGLAVLQQAVTQRPGRPPGAYR